MRKASQMAKCPCGFIGVFNSVAATMGGGVIAYGAIMGASIIGGLFEGTKGFASSSSIVISGIQLITKEPLTGCNLSIVAVALGVGYGMDASTGILIHIPQAIQLIFGGSGIVPAAMVAILLNILLPKDKAE